MIFLDVFCGIVLIWFCAFLSGCALADAIILGEGGYSFKPSGEGEIARDIKEKFACVSENCEAEMTNAETSW